MDAVSQVGLIESFRDAQIQIRSDAYLREKTRHMQAGTRLYLDQYVAVAAKRKAETPSVSVVGDTTFSCAGKWIRAGEKTAVLNFANACIPGGGVKNGAMAQEECLCRSSNLYESLTLPYIVRHYYKWNQRNTGDMGSDLIIYSPDVTVFRTDDIYPATLPKAQWFDVDVITCAAPYVDEQKKKPVSADKLRQVLEDRIRNILEVAAANDVDHLILGAFGCGAFHNPPEMVAGVFKSLLIDDGYALLFQSVVFAIKKDDAPRGNLSVFRSVFSHERADEKKKMRCDACTMKA
ncbi:MAG: TIGR02452 family protein [Clostridia bacterium]|nr:TIGR02452 family protein [Clostridia bacterium]